ncbi:MULTISPECIES: magnesium chelatase domain-containing protein [unclassified Streptomyces]|uniref:magnesium chelatase domain-containing protein n=1 Tax=unclassified Streptomyces TaxID=2593676 RepID=UPI00037CEEA4|nr:MULTISPECIES: magnesium chelatase domain-containing protein [unclassified Streptomyces]MYX39010.1 hypothetical protein [Streptomyces sp. SID8377]
MTETCPTSPEEAALSHAFNDAYATATQARRDALAAAAAYVAHLIRPHLPAAATIGVDTADGELRTVRDCDRSVLWYAPASAGAGLPDGVVDEVEGLMRDVLELGADEKALEDMGWSNPDAYSGMYDLTLPGTPEERERREYIVAGQKQGAGFELWDVAPAPTDPDKRARALEELEVDAHDAFGTIETVWAATAREAVTTLVAELGKVSGLADYGLTEDSNTDCLSPAAKAEPGKARAAAVVGRVLHEVEAGFIAGHGPFRVTDFDGTEQRETSDRILAAILNSGIGWPGGTVAARTTWTGPSPAGDLAIACAALSAAGPLPGTVLEHVAVIGELGLDGTLRSAGDVPAAVAAARNVGRRTVVVPAEHGALDLPGVFVCGAGNLRDALALLNVGAQVLQ